MIDYDREAEIYDATRGGEPRAAAAAGAVRELLPGGTRVLLDIACGTGIVTQRLRSPGRTVLGVDRSVGMLGPAARRLDAAVACGDATRLPIGTGRVDAVTLIWLLHLVPDPAPVLAEAARVLRPGGVLITTVDKDESPYIVHSDIADLITPMGAGYRADATDRYDRVTALMAGRGFQAAGETTFPGVGQGRSPRQWAEAVSRGRMRWSQGREDELIAALAALPDQDVARPDPQYRLIAMCAPKA